MRWRFECRQLLPEAHVNADTTMVPRRSVSLLWSEMRWPISLSAASEGDNASHQLGYLAAGGGSRWLRECLRSTAAVARCAN
jgi:hypothetical protein